MSTETATSEQKRVWGVLASFENAQDIYHACEAIHGEGYRKFDSYTPFPVHGLEKVSGLKRSKVPIFTFIGGVTGFILGNIIVWYMNAFDYPLIVGGKPYFSPIFPFPVTYEMTILFAAFGSLGGMFLMNLLPRYNHPVFNHPDFMDVTDDRFFVAIERGDPKFNLETTTALLEKLGATTVDAIPE